MSDVCLGVLGILLYLASPFFVAWVTIRFIFPRLGPGFADHPMYRKKESRDE